MGFNSVFKGLTYVFQVFLYSRYGVFPWGKERPGRDADPSPCSSAVVKKE